MPPAPPKHIWQTGFMRAIVATERAALAAMRLANILNSANIQVGPQAPVSHHCPNAT